MFDYEIRLNYFDGTFEIVTVTALDIPSAIENAEALAFGGPESVESSTLLRSIDRQRQEFLAW